LAIGLDPLFGANTSPLLKSVKTSAIALIIQIVRKLCFESSIHLLGVRKTSIRELSLLGNLCSLAGFIVTRLTELSDGYSFPSGFSEIPIYQIGVLAREDGGF